MEFNTIRDVQDARVTVMGLGRFLQGSGIGASKWLLRHGAKLTITDLKSEEELHASVDAVRWAYVEAKKMHPDRVIHEPRFVLGEHQEADFTNTDLVVRNPDVHPDNPLLARARENGIPLASDVSLFLRFCPFPITGVTGTRGKTTTTSLIGAMYQAMDPRAVTAGNLKVSPLEYLDELLVDLTPRPIVLELSSALIDTLDDQQTGPQIAVFTNLFPDHLNRYGTLEAYKKAKERMFTMQTPDQVAVLNADNEEVKEMASRVKGKIFWFSTKSILLPEANSAFVRDGVVVLRHNNNEEVIIPVSDIALQGEHNQENVLAAVCVARLSGVSVDQIVQVLKTFQGVPERQEVLGTVNGVTYVDDTTATSPEGAIAALRRFGADKHVVLLAGGASKHLPFEALGETIRSTCKYVILFEGTATDDLQNAIGKGVSLKRVSSMKEAMEVAVSVAESGDTVLLSPGTASFGIFKNEFDRGAQFKEEVKKIMGGF